MEALIAKFKKLGTAQLLVKVEKSIGEEKEAILFVLTQRGQNVLSSPKEDVSKQNIIEIEPEDDLTIEEKKIIENAEKDEEKISSNLFKEAEKVYKLVIRDKKSDSYQKLMNILGQKPFDKKLLQFDLKQIIALAVSSKNLHSDVSTKEKLPSNKKEKSLTLPEGFDSSKYIKGSVVEFLTETGVVSAKIRRIISETKVRLTLNDGKKVNKNFTELTLK